MRGRRMRLVVLSALAAAAPGGCGGGGGGSANVEPIGPGRYDPDFGIGGAMRWAAGGPGWTGVVPLPDGRIVVVGTRVRSSTNSDFVVIRFGETGRVVDTSFGTGGSAFVDVGGVDEAFGVVRRPSDGAIIVVGRTNSEGGGAIAIAALTASGAPDPALEGIGRKVIDVTNADDEARAVAIQLDENVVIAGNSGVSTGTSNFLLYRMSPGGVLDIGADTVNGTGPATVTWGNDDRCAAVAIDPVTGDIVLAGSTDATGSPDDLADFAVARFLSTGVLDTSFDGDGTRLIDIDYLDRAFGVQVDTVGRTLVSGTTFDGELFSMTAVRLGQTGAIDTSWNAAPVTGFPHNGAGFFQHHLQEIGRWSDDKAFCSLLQPDGSLVLAGESSVPSQDADAAILRLDPAGHLDPTFGTLPLGGNVFRFVGPGRALAIASDGFGRLVLAGQQTTPAEEMGYLIRVGE
jgi:uncharacterized delta-60 repeat protein